MESTDWLTSAAVADIAQRNAFLLGLNDRHGWMPMWDADTARLSPAWPWPQGLAAPKRWLRNTQQVLKRWGSDARRSLKLQLAKAISNWIDFLHTPALRHAIWTVAGVVMFSTAMAATLVVQGYNELNEEDWRQRLAAWRMTPIYLKDGTLLGAAAPLQGAMDIDWHKHGYVDAGDPPKLFVDMLLSLEQAQYHNPWRTWFGLDPLSTGARVLRGDGGGSTLSMQLSKILLSQGKESGWALVERKFTELGRALHLYKTLGHEGVLRGYSMVAPMLAYGGTTRGLATAHVVFGKPAAELEPFQLAILAAAVLHNIRLVSKDVMAPGCERLLADPTTPNDARKQCLLFRRAEVALRHTLRGPLLEGELAKLKALEYVGVSVTNAWQPLPTQRMANLFSRRAALLPTGALEQLSRELDGVAHDTNQEVVVSLDPAQPRFARDVVNTLHQLELGGVSQLCAALTMEGTPRQCPGVNPPQPLRAETTLLRVNIRSGEIERMFQSTRFSSGLVTRLGSVAKLAIAVAAVRQGWSANDKICPRRLVVGGRALRRVSQPYEGYTRCGQGEMISLAQAMGDSDSLAMMELAKLVGEPALRAAVKDLGLQVDEAGGSLSYQLAFGTQAGTVRDLARMAQKVMGAAYQVPIQAAPHLVKQSVVPRADNALTLKASQVRALRTMVEAPLLDGATLEWASALGQAGKSGTTSSITKPSTHGRPYAAGKLAAIYDPKRMVLYISAIYVPDAPFALAAHNLKGGFFEPVVALLAKDYAPHRQPAEKRSEP